MAAASRLAGEVADWLPWAESFVDLSQWQLAGVGRVQAELAYAAGVVDVKDAKADLARFRRTATCFIDERQLSVTGTARYEAAKQRRDIPLATLKLGDAASRLENASRSRSLVKRLPSPPAPRIDGDLKQIGRWLQDPGDYRLAGTVRARSMAKPKSNSRGRRVRPSSM